MAATLGRAADSPHLQAHPRLSLKQFGYDYTVELADGEAMYEVKGANGTLRVPLQWVFGSGRTGQTFVYSSQGKLYESRVSYYAAIKGLDLTTGAIGTTPKDLVEAAGRQLSADAARDCFGCHGSAPGGARTAVFESLIPGVSCEKCHGPGEEHMRGFASERKAPGPIVGFRKATAEQILEACGRCHRTWADIMAMNIRGVNTVRFQPYRLTNSRCYDALDRRVSCVACHDPHKPHEMSVARVDAACRSCHTAGVRAAKTCPRATQNCGSCHMPKYEIPGTHGMFTDHTIRIVRAGERIPD
jgi:hypothetical protein